MTYAHLIGGAAHGQSVTFQHDTPCLRLQSFYTPKLDLHAFWDDATIDYWIYPLGSGPHQLYVADFHQSNQNN